MAEGISEQEIAEIRAFHDARVSELRAWKIPTDTRDAYIARLLDEVERLAAELREAHLLRLADLGQEIDGG